ncbi:MAG: proteasome accessory factor PafA2 family protein [Verrucomicrobia bacterium]|nr:proteasome accessory factor PafA2 family protein [Verrucomicrobiota bacterium]MBI3868956.1 proteasome accessory factor PafA2 family protein [Verrucomicrobiota bacterium]
MKSRLSDAPASDSPRRITGIETEYGCLVDPPLQVYEVIGQVRDWIFSGQRYGLIDRHDRDWDEPAGNGGFLFNGGRLYLDMGHLEYCTGECGSALDLVRYDRAGDQLLNEALEALGLADKVTFVRNNIDHYTGATFGCHENYSLLRSAPLSQKNVLSLLTFLTVRTLYAGAGRVGGSHARRVIGENGSVQEAGPFQISQRADYIQNDFFEWVQHNRAIINTRDEPLADPRLYRRLHLIHGDTNVLPSASFLKVGATRLVFDLLEANDLPNFALQDAVTSLRKLSRCLNGPWPVRMSDGKHMDALDLLSQYHYRAHRRFAGRDLETDAILGLWSDVIERLGGAKETLVGTVDWITKEHVFQLFCDSEGIDWDHPWLEAQDLEFHSTCPARSLAAPLANLNGPWATPVDNAACSRPPETTRAKERSRLMREIQERPAAYVIDWDSVQIDDREPTYLLNPFHSGASLSSALKL